MADDLLDLEAELRALADALVVPESDLAPAVLARLAAEPAPRRRGARGWWASLGRWGRARWRAVVAVLVGGLVAVGVATPVGATVVRWLRFGGVEVVQGPPPSPPITSSTTPPNTTPSAPSISIADAAALAGFEPLMPAGLGPPTRVELTADLRVLTLVFQTGDGTIRIDEFAGSVAPFFVKKYFEDIDLVQVDGRDALWFDRPHYLIYVDAQGRERQESERTAAQTLVWQRGDLTLRLEGVPDLNRAVAIAESTR